MAWPAEESLRCFKRYLFNFARSGTLLLSSWRSLQGKGVQSNVGTTARCETLSPWHSALRSALLGGPWVVISGVISRVTILITHISGLITPLPTTHEPPSTLCMSVKAEQCRHSLAHGSTQTEAGKVPQFVNSSGGWEMYEVIGRDERNGSSIRTKP